MEIPTYIATRFQKPGEEAPPTATGAPIAAGLKKVADAFAKEDLAIEQAVGVSARLGEFVARKGQLSDQVGALEDSLARDPDHRTYFDRAKKGIEEISNATLSGVSDPALKNALVSHVSARKDLFLTDARHQARALTVDFTRGALERDIDRNIGEATSTSDARGLLQAEGNIAAAVNGAVTGGIWTVEHGAKIARGAKEKIHTTLGMQLADQEPERFLSNYKEGLYKDTVDPMKLEEIRRHAEGRKKSLETVDNLQAAGSAAEETWGRMGPVSDLTPVNLDVMEGEISKLFAGNQERAKLARAVLREKTTAHDKGVAERKAANLSTIWNAAKDGRSIAQIGSMPEYTALDGHSQYQVQKDLEDRSWTMKGRAEADPTRKAEQHRLYWETLPKLPGMTENAIMAMYPRLGVELTDRLVESRRALVNPAKAAEAKIDQDDFNHFAREAGIKPEASRYSDNRAILGEVKYKVETAIDVEQRAKGRILNREEKAKIMRRGLMEVDVRVKEPSFFSSGLQKRRVFDVQSQENIYVPPDYKERITENLTDRGIPVTEENVAGSYILLKEWVEEEIGKKEKTLGRKLNYGEKEELRKKVFLVVDELRKNRSSGGKR